MSALASTPLRAGDWICTICNNLNFSFRNECNRCQLQTKTQNFVQNLLSISKENPFHQTQGQQASGRSPQYTSKQESCSKRQPLGDITKKILNESRALSPQRDDETPSGKNSDLSLAKENKESAVSFPDEKIESGSGFKKALLLTPPRAMPLVSAEDSVLTPMPYKSPYKLPSISQFLQNLMLSSSSNSSRNLSSNKTCKKSKCLLENSSCSSQKTMKIKKKKGIEAPKKSFSVLDKKGDGNPTNFVPSNLGSILGEQKLSPCDTHTDAEKMIQSCINKIFEGEEELGKERSKISGRMKSGKANNSKCEKLGESAPVKERKKDWLCSYCGNLNYSFRVCCNRCQASK